MKLYYIPGSTAARVRWMLEELGVPYELVRIDPSAADDARRSTPGLHPLGYVPVLVDGDLTMFESGAILLHLADTHLEAGLAPPVGTPARALCYQWLSFAMTELIPTGTRYVQHTASLSEERRVPWIVEAARKGAIEMLDAVQGVLERQPFMLSEGFSVVDMMVGPGLMMCERGRLLEGRPALVDYVERLRTRPAFQRTMAD